MSRGRSPDDSSDDGRRLFIWDPIEANDQASVQYHPASVAAWSDGGAFDYACSESIFLGRSGIGPLRVAWDTNVLIDWVQHGRPLIDNLELGPEVGANHAYSNELRALGNVVELSFTRDIRVRVSPRQLRDGRLRGHRYALRAEQLTQVDASTACTCDEPRRVHRRRPELVRMRRSMDRYLVEDAIAAGCHVFLTRDQDDVLSAAEYIRSFGVAAMRPSALWTALTDCGESACPEGVDGMVCDNHKFVHLLALLPPGLA